MFTQAPSRLGSQTLGHEVDTTEDEVLSATQYMNDCHSKYFPLVERKLCVGCREGSKPWGITCPCNAGDATREVYSGFVDQFDTAIALGLGTDMLLLIMEYQYSSCELWAIATDVNSRDPWRHIPVLIPLTRSVYDAHTLRQNH